MVKIMKKQYINFIKILSIFFVINIHLLSKAWNIANPSSLNFKILTFIDILFHICVPLFAMSSGSIFLNRDDNNKKIFFKYILKIYLIFILFSISYKVADVVYYQDSSLSVSLMLKIIKDSILLKSIYHLWYLRVVIVMYLSIPLFKLLFKIKNKYIDHIILLGLILIIKVLPIFITNGTFVSIMSVVGFIIYFYLGYYLEKYFDKKLLYIFIPVFFFSYYYTFTKTISTSISMGIPNINHLEYLTYNIMFMSIFSFLLIYKFKDLFTKKKIKNILDFLSTYNFMVYLFHGFTIGLLSKLNIIDIYKYNNYLLIFIYGIMVYLLTLLYVIPIKVFIKNFKTITDKYLSKIIVTFILIQPILDLLTSLEINVIHSGISIGTIVRSLFLILCSYYIFFVNKENKYKYLLGIIITYIISYAAIIMHYKGSDVFIYEMRNCIYTYYLPISLIALYLMFKNKAIDIKLKYIFIMYLVCIAFILIPNLTHTGYKSYYESKVGSIGWFYSANSIGNMLSFLLPFIIYYLIKSKQNIFLKILIILSSLYVFVSMGTKVPVLGLALCLLIHFIYYFIKWIKEKKYTFVKISIGAFIVGIISIIIILPKTSFYKNIEIHKDFLGFNHYYEVFTDYKLVDHFIFSQRLTFLKNTNNNYKDVHLSEKILGMGYIENYHKDNESDKTIEMDYFEVFYRHGIIGCIIFYIVVLPFIYVFFKTKHEKSLLNLEFRLSLALILLLSLFSGHVLVTPSISIFVALLINIYINKDNYYNYKLDKKIKE